MALSAALVLVFGLVGALNLYELPPPRVSVTAAAITIESGPARMAVSPEEITSLSLEDNLPRLRKRLGWSSYSTLRGRFSTDRSAGWVHVSRRDPPYILLQTADSFLIFNDSDPAKTRTLYDSMIDRWQSSRR